MITMPRPITGEKLILYHTVYRPVPVNQIDSMLEKYSMHNNDIIRFFFDVCNWKVK